MPTTARIAAYTANLVLLAVVVAGPLAYSDLYAPREREAAEAWHAQALLWHSQLGEEEWSSIVSLIAVERYWLVVDGERDVRLTLDLERTPPPPPDPHWTFERPAAERGGYAFADGAPVWLVQRRANFVCGSEDDLIQRTLRPLLESSIEVAMRTFVSWLPDYPSAAEALLTVLLLPALPQDDPERRRAAYRDCARIAAEGYPPWNDRAKVAYAGRLLAALATDEDAGADIAVDVLERIGLRSAASDLVRCAQAVLERTRSSDPGYEKLTRFATGHLRAL